MLRGNLLERIRSLRTKENELTRRCIARRQILEALEQRYRRCHERLDRTV